MAAPDPTLPLQLWLGETLTATIESWEYETPWFHARVMPRDEARWRVLVACTDFRRWLDAQPDDVDDAAVDREMTARGLTEADLSATWAVPLVGANGARRLASPIWADPPHWVSWRW